jgi:hypothetical protein
MARTGGDARVYAIFVQPPGWTEADVKGSLWKRASAIPGVIPMIDREGIEARRFGASTSGHLMVFDSGANLAFAGGITASRGHSGENPGLLSAIEAVRSGQAPLKRSRVYGCSLFGARG